MLPVCNVKKVLIIVFCLLTVNYSIAESIEWHSGVVVLRSNEVLNGELALHPQHDLVLFRQGDQVSVYPAHRILSVYYYDAKFNINRKFTSIQQEATSFASFRLFEIVLMGEISVVRRAMPAALASLDDAKEYHYFVRSGNELVAARKFRSKVYHKLLESSAMLQQYIKEKKLDPASTADIIQIVDFYNQHQPSENAIARY